MEVNTLTNKTKLFCSFKNIGGKIYFPINKIFDIDVRGPLYQSVLISKQRMIYKFKIKLPVIPSLIVVPPDNYVNNLEPWNTKTYHLRRSKDRIMYLFLSQIFLGQDNLYSQILLCNQIQPLLLFKTHTVTTKMSGVHLKL